MNPKVEVFFVADNPVVRVTIGRKSISIPPDSCWFRFSNGREGWIE